MRYSRLTYPALGLAVVGAVHLHDDSVSSVTVATEVPTTVPETTTAGEAPVVPSSAPDTTSAPTTHPPQSVARTGHVRAASAAPASTTSSLGFRDKIFHDATSTTSTPSQVVISGQLYRIRGCESYGDPTREGNYSAQNPTSTASGAFQVVDGTWRSWASTYGRPVGATSYSRAKYAPPSVQDYVAYYAYKAQGSSPWNASRGCWG